MKVMISLSAGVRLSEVAADNLSAKLASLKTESAAPVAKPSIPRERESAGAKNPLLTILERLHKQVQTDRGNPSSLLPALEKLIASAMMKLAPFAKKLEFLTEDEDKAFPKGKFDVRSLESDAGSHDISCYFSGTVNEEEFYFGVTIEGNFKGSLKVTVAANGKSKDMKCTAAKPNPEVSIENALKFANANLSKMS